MTRRGTASILSFLGALALLLMSGVSCEQAPEEPMEPTPVETPATAEPVQGGELVIARAAATTSMDPPDVFEGESVKVIGQIYEGLVRFAPGSTEIEPALATRWESSDDGRVWTFHLREGVRFHDGTPFDAEAVVFSIERQMKPDHPFHDGQFNNWNNTFAGHIRGVEAVDDRTVRVTLEEPFAPILSGFAVYSMSVISPESVREHGASWLDRNAAGTGPFRLQEWTADDRIVLTANEEYWGGRPHLDRAEFRVVSDAEERARLLESGEVHLAEGLDQAGLSRLRGRAGVEVQKKPGLNVGYLAFNTAREPFTDPEVRRAVALAMDHPGIVRATYQELGVRAKNYLPPVLWGHADQVAPFPYAPDRARDLLAEAGHPEGFRFTLDVMKNARPYMPQPLKTARMIRDRLQAVGIEVEVRENEWDEYLTRTVRSPEADYEACLLGWMADMPDPNDFLYVMFHSDNADLESGHGHQNIALYRNPTVDELTRRAQREQDREARAELYRRVQEIVRKDVPVIPLAHSFMVLAHDEAVRGLKVPVTSSNYGLREVWLADREAAAPGS
ncbi:MAG: ABC transporter substrate-binding protein [Thermoanaerobaculia bacterium]|nr:ABC transporter substrate-binding protein [Thermoanaerobaculia bacterium]